MTTYIEAVTRRDHDWEKFDPKSKQKAIYLWYDRQYSDDALDIYSKEWQERIRNWNQAWYEAYQLGFDKSSKALTNDELLESLDLGIFFLAHPVAAFALWKVLQASYELDRIICGDNDQVHLWQTMPPFMYFKDQGVQSKWQSEIEILNEQTKTQVTKFGKQSSKFKMHEILVGVERYEHAVSSLKENFAYNGEGKEFASWMAERIEQGFEQRLAVIELLDFQDNELRSMHQTQSFEVSSPHKTMANLSQEYVHRDTLSTYSSSAAPNFSRNDTRTRNRLPASKSRSNDRQSKRRSDRIMASIKTRAKRLNCKIRKQTHLVKSFRHR